MASARTVQTLRGALKTAHFLATQPAGVSVREVADALGLSRATVYRNLQRLREAGFAIESGEVEDDGRVRLLLDARLPQVGAGIREQLALRLLRGALPTLDDTFVADALDELLGKVKRKVQGPARAPHKTGPTRETLDTIARAIRVQRRLTFRYRGASDTRDEPRLVDPIELRLVRDQLYLVAWDVERNAARTFKPARMTAAFVSPEPAAKHAIDVEALLATSVRIWDGRTYDVVVRISQAKARFVEEWQLHPSQRVQAHDDGSVHVSANVAGLVEVMRWVLSWGKDACVIGPAELREMLVKEIDEMRVAYGGPEKRGARARVSHQR